MTIKVNIYEKDMEWLMQFGKLHRLATSEESIKKLIEINKAWTRKL